MLEASEEVRGLEQGLVTGSCELQATVVTGCSANNPAGKTCGFPV